MGRCSSLHEDFVRVKTLIDLERFEAENLLSLKKIAASLLAREILQSKIELVRFKTYP